MRFNRKRHLLLKKLSEKYIQKNMKGGAVSLGMSIIEINKLLKVDNLTREKIVSELLRANELILYDFGDKSGFFIEHKNGLSAFSDKKYLKRNENIIINWFKVFVQIAVPVLSLIITILVIIKDDSKTTKEIQSIEQKVEDLKNKINKLEKNTKTLPNHKINDSV